jgi:hypothetical protein
MMAIRLVSALIRYRLIILFLIQLRPLSDRITHSNSYDIAVRRLYVDRTPVMRQQVDAFISEIMDRPYKTNLLTLFNASVETRAKLLGYAKNSCIHMSLFK